MRQASDQLTEENHWDRALLCTADSSASYQSVCTCTLRDNVGIIKWVEAHTVVQTQEILKRVKKSVLSGGQINSWLKLLG